MNRIEMKIFINQSILIIAFMLFLTSYCQAQDLLQLLEEGKQNYPYLKSKQFDINSADRKINSFRTEHLPSLVVADQFTYSTSNNVEGAFFPNEGTAFAPSGGIRPQNIYEGTFGSYASALLDWRIINFGKISANVNVAKADKQKAEKDYDNEILQFQIRLADTYLLLLISQQLTAVQKYNLQRSEILMSAVNANVSAGIRPGVDSALAHAEYIKAKLLLLESEKNETTNRLRLQELSGKSIPQHADTMIFFQLLPEKYLNEEKSVLKSPLLQYYRSLQDVSVAKSISIRRSFYPSISLIGYAWARGSGISKIDNSYHTDLSSGIHFQVYNYLAGVAMKWNLTSFFKIKNDVKSAQFQTEKFKELFNTQYLAQERQLRESEIQFDVALNQALLAPIQVSSARAAFSQALIRYETGLTDLPTFTQSLLTLNRAEADAYIAYSNAWRGLLMKAAALGDIAVFLNQVK